MSDEFILFKDVKIPFIYEKDNSLPIVAMKIVFLSCGKMQNGSKYGIANLSAKMLEEGTKELGSEFLARLEEKAVDFSVYADNETLTISISSLKENFKYATSMLKDLFLDPNLSKKTLYNVKQITLGNILRKNSDFDYLASISLNEILYENTPLAYPSLGTKESIESIEIKDIKIFLDIHLDLNNVAIVMGGDIEKPEAVDQVTNILSTLQKGKKRTEEFINVGLNERIKIVKQPSEQAYIYFGSPFYMKIGDPNAYKAQVSSFILGSSGFGSRLMEEIRVKKGLAYSVYSQIVLAKNTSLFSGYLQTKKENKNEAVESIKAIIKDFTTKGVSKFELDKAKKFILGSEPLRNETLLQRLSRNFMDFYSGYEVGYAKKKLELISNLNLDDLNDFIAFHDEIEKLNFAIVIDEDLCKIR